MTIERPIIQKWEKHADTHVSLRASYLLWVSLLLGLDLRGAAAAAAIMVEFGSIEFKVPISRLTLARLPFSIEIRIAIQNNAISIFGEGREMNNLVELWEIKKKTIGMAMFATFLDKSIFLKNLDY